MQSTLFHGAYLSPDWQVAQVGQSVYAIGNPFGLDQTLTCTSATA